uniref:Uncharacterized protein n=1 Tax=Clytia hemisphaerica TaxID=252671 RepID=A0A7M5XA94_9CNID
MSSARNQSVTSSGPGATWSAKSCSSNERSVHGFYTNTNSTVSAPSTSRPGIDESVLQCPAEGGKNQVSFDGDLSNIENPDVFLSLYMVNQKLGACYYDSDVQILYVMKDIIEDNNFTMLKKLLLQVLPTVILVSTKQKEEFIECIKNLGEVQGKEESQERWNVELCPANTFNYDMAKRKILSMSGLPGLTDQMDDEDRHLYFSSRIAFEDTNMICSVGSLLRHLDRVRPGVELETDTPVPILFMKIFALDDVMSVDEYTYSSLQIFQREFHPSVYKAGGTKEGLSLFARRRKNSFPLPQPSKYSYNGMTQPYR